MTTIAMPNAPAARPNGNFVVNEIKLMVAPKSPGQQAGPRLHGGGRHFPADFSFTAAGAVDFDTHRAGRLHPADSQAARAGAETKHRSAQPASACSRHYQQQYTDGLHNLAASPLSVSASRSIPLPSAAPC